jgi:hypothetical protein
MALSHMQVGFRQSLQIKCFYEGSSAMIQLVKISQLLFAYLIVLNNYNDNATEALVASLLHVNIAQVLQYFRNFTSLQILDYLHHDILPDEEVTVSVPPRQNIRFNSWTDFDCYENTCFRKDQLRRIYNCFGIDRLGDPITGDILISTGCFNQRGDACGYNFNSEELFLYTMTRMKMKTGLDHTKLCKNIFGGSSKRWSFAWRFMMKYLDNRYRSIIGHQGLVRFVHQFPEFYEAIQQKVQRGYYKRDNHDGTYDYTSGLSFLPFNIFGFIDCSIDKICRPFSGPAGDYEGAGRKDTYTDTQRAFYTGYKRLHGIKVETVLNKTEAAATWLLVNGPAMEGRVTP